MKNISKIAGIFVALVLSVAFIACANNAAPSENNTSNVSQGNTSSDPLAGYTYTNNAWGMSCTFESGGNITMRWRNRTEHGTYTVNGNTATVTADDGDIDILTTTDNWATFVWPGDINITATRQ